MHRRLAVVLAAMLLAAPASAQAQAQAPVGRLAEATGPVQARDDARGWSALPRGTSLNEGQSLRTQSRSQAELDLGANRIGLDPDTVLRIDSAHPAAPSFALNQGRAMFLLRSLQPGQEARVTTPRATIALIQPGLYVVDAGSDGRPLTIGVTRGMAQAVGAGVSLMIPAGQTGVIGGTDARPASLRAGVAEGFLADDPAMPPLPQVVRPAMRAPAPGQAQGYTAYAPPPEIVELPGGDALLRDGSWAGTPDYGPVWYPPVAPGWSPYADPWGERTAWGYAPWHYGTWVAIGPRWGWRPPPRHHYPYYARGQRPPPLPQDYGRPPPAVAQPNRPSPFWGNPPPRGPDRAFIPGQPPADNTGFRGGRPSPPPGAPPLVSIPQSGPQSAPPAAPPPAPPQPNFWGRPSGGSPPGFASPPAFAAPRPSPPPMMAAPPPPRPMPAPAPAPARRCGMFGNPC